MNEWDPRAGDLVALAGESEHGHDPARVGTILDPSAVDPDGGRHIAVQFPWSDSVVVVPLPALELVDRPAEPRAPSMLLAAAERIGRQLGELEAPGGLIASVVRREQEQMTPPEGVAKHPFEGRDDACPFPGCGAPARNPVHRALPPYRLRWLEDLVEGAPLFMQDEERWVRCTVLERRDRDGNVFLIVLDDDGDQRPVAGHALTTVAVPVQ